MDREEFQIKLDEINTLVEKKDYKKAMEIVDSIDWRRVKNIRTLCTVGEIYAVNKRYENSREIFLLAYHRASVGKSILYRLIEVSIKMGDVDEALDYYNEFLNVAPNDNTQYVLKYKIYNARKAPLDEQIAILEEYKEKEYTERWSYELAKLYYQNGNLEKCTEICDDMVIWFGDGKFVHRALDLKQRYTQLTVSQQKIYEEYLHPVIKPAAADKKIAAEKEEKSEPVRKEEVREEAPKKTEEQVREEVSFEEPERRINGSRRGRRPLNRMEKAFQAINSIKEDVKNVKNEIFSDSSVMEEADVEKEEAAGKKEEEISEKALSLAETIESIAQVKPVFTEEEEEFQKKVSEGIKNIFQMKSVSMNETEDDLKEEENAQIPGQINISDIIPDTKSEVHDDIPELEEEEILKKPAMPKFEMPKMEMNEAVKVEDLPIEQEISFNLEDTILAAAAQQGIEVSKDEPEEEEKVDSEASFTGDFASEEAEELEFPEEDTEIPSLEEEPKTESQIVPKTVEVADELPQETEDSEEEALKEETSEVQTLEEPMEDAVHLSPEEELMNFIDEQNRDLGVEENDMVIREPKLDDEEVKLFKYFADVPGMREQIGEVLKDTQLSAADKTSNTGNVIIMGNRGSGKTMLFDMLTKAICRQLKLPAAKIAKITAEQFNQMDIPKVVNQLSGGFLLIQDVNKMTAEAAQSLDQAMEFRTDGLTVIIEDEKIGMRKFIARNDKLIKKFTCRIAIPVFTNDELVNFAKIYTSERGYKIEEMAILALYTSISDNQKEDEPMTVDSVRVLLDTAIAKAESGTRKIKRNLSKTRTDRDGLVILYEKDFK